MMTNPHIKTGGCVGKLLVFEGVDAVGKSSLCQAVCDELRHQKINHKMLSFPGRDMGTIGELIYRIHHRHAEEFSINTIDPLALQTLHIAAHIDLINRKICAKILSGCWIVLDRFWWSTYVYGVSDGIRREQVEALVRVEKNVWGDCLPDLVVLIDSEVPLRDDEQGNSEWHTKRQLYQSLAEKEKENYEIMCISNKMRSLFKEQENSGRAKEIINTLRLG